MIVEPPASIRKLRSLEMNCGLAVIGGGLAGVCCAITAARAGLKVVLVQDRPVLGGNASSEVRLWILGATSHMGNNNRWAREGGVIDELLVENMHRNPEGNPLILDTILLEMVVARAEHHPAAQHRRPRPRKSRRRHDRGRPRVLLAELDLLRNHRAAVLRRHRRRHRRLPGRRRIPHAAPRARDEFGELFAPPASRPANC